MPHNKSFTWQRLHSNYSPGKYFGISVLLHQLLTAAISDCSQPEKEGNAMEETDLFNLISWFV